MDKIDNKRSKHHDYITLNRFFRGFSTDVNRFIVNFHRNIKIKDRINPNFALS